MSRKVLGRGLDALIPGESPATTSDPGTRIMEIPLESIQPNPEQPRHEMSAEALEDLAGSIREYGVIEPVVVRSTGSGYILIAGERRVMAARKAGLSTVPAIERPSDDPEEMLAVALIENIQREDLNAVDEALGYRRLQDEFGLTQEEVARRVGKNRVTVSNSLRLLQLPAEILTDVSRGNLSAGHARAILTLEDVGRQKALWQRVREERLSVRATEEAARAMARANGGDAESPRPPKKRAAPSRDPRLAYLEERLRQQWATQVRIVPRRKKGGRLEIDYFDSGDLNRLLDLLGVSEDA